MLAGTWREWRVVPILAVLAAIPVTGFGQTPDPLTVTGKLHYHAKSTYGPGSMLGLAAYAAIMLKARTGQGQCWVWPHTPLSYRQTARRWSGKRAAKPTAGVWLPWWPGPESIALWLSVWTRRCMRTRGTFDRAAQGSGAGRGTRCAEPFSRTPIAAAKRCPSGVSAATTAQPFFPTCGIRTGSIRRVSGLSRVRQRSGSTSLAIWEGSFGPISRERCCADNDHSTYKSHPVGRLWPFDSMLVSKRLFILGADA